MTDKLIYFECLHNWFLRILRLRIMRTFVEWRTWLRCRWGGYLTSKLKRGYCAFLSLYFVPLGSEHPALFPMPLRLYPLFFFFFFTANAQDNEATSFVVQRWQNKTGKMLRKEPEMSLNHRKTQDIQRLSHRRYSLTSWRPDIKLKWDDFSPDFHSGVAGVTVPYS